MVSIVRSMVVFLTLYIFAGALPVLAQGPQISLDRAVFDFGEILQGESLEHVFVIRNTGDENLIISRVRSSCGCTAALLSAEVIAPGEKGEVRATFNSGNFRGQVEKSIHLTSNDPRQVATKLRIRGRVLPVLDAPQDINLGVFKPGEQREVRVQLTNRSKETITLNSVESTLPLVRVVKAVTNLPPGKSGEIVLRAEIAGTEPVNGYLLVRTDSPRLPELRLLLFGTAVSR